MFTKLMKWAVVGVSLLAKQSYLQQACPELFEAAGSYRSAELSA